MMGDKGASVLSTLDREFIANVANGTQYDRFIDVVQTNELFGTPDTSSVNDVISQIHTCINASKTRLEGLVLLYKVLQQCSTEVFVQHAKTWSGLMLEILKSQNVGAFFEMCCSVIGLLLQYSATFPEINREFSASFVPALLKYLTDLLPQWLDATLKCLSKCIIYYPGPCGNFKNKIEACVTQYMTGERQKTGEIAGRVFAMLPRCGGGGNLGVKHTESWTLQCDKLVGSLHLTLDDLFENCETDLTKDYTSTSSLNLPVPDEDEPSRAFTLATRLHILTHSLVKLLSYEFPAVVKVPQEDILTVVFRILALTQKQLMTRPTKERIILSSQIPSLHMNALHLIQALILCCKGYLINHHLVINKCFVSCLDWTFSTDEVYGANKPLSDLRATIYQTVHIWIESLGTSTGIELFAGDICRHLLQDILPQDGTMKASSNVSTEDNRGGKRQKRKFVVSVGHLSSHRKINPAANSTLCLAALRGLRSILYKSGCLLKAYEYKKVQKVLIETVMGIQNGNLSPPIPYNNVMCRKAAYEAPLACISSSPHDWAPPTQLAINLFDKATQDSDQEVCSFSRLALVTCEMIVHPCAPSFNVPCPTNSVNVQANDRTTLQAPPVLQQTFITSTSEQERPAAGGTNLLEDDMEDDAENIVSVTSMVVENSEDAIDESDTDVIDLGENSRVRDSTPHEDAVPMNNVAEELTKVDIIVPRENIEIEPTSDMKKDSEHVDDVTAKADDPSTSHVTEDHGNSREETEDEEIILVAKRKLENIDAIDGNTTKKLQTDASLEDVQEMLADFVEDGPDADLAYT